jgi:predicted ATP-dependent serine protease
MNDTTKSIGNASQRKEEKKNFLDLNNLPKPETELDFQIYGLIKGQIGILFGQGAVGKGFFLKHFFTSEYNLMYEKPLKIMYLSLEDGFEIVARKYYEMEIIHECVHCMFKMEKDVPSIVEQFKNYDLVIIDTWSRFLAGRYDENSNKEMGKAYEELITIAELSDCAILVVAHVNKSSINPEVAMDITALRGASTLADNARLAISLEKTKNEDEILAKTQKINQKQIKQQELWRDKDNGSLKTFNELAKDNRKIEL